MIKAKSVEYLRRKPSCLGVKFILIQITGKAFFNKFLTTLLILGEIDIRLINTGQNRYRPVVC